MKKKLSDGGLEDNLLAMKRFQEEVDKVVHRLELEFPDASLPALLRDRMQSVRTGSYPAAKRRQSRSRKRVRIDIPIRVNPCGCTVINGTIKVSWL